MVKQRGKSRADRPQIKRETRRQTTRETLVPASVRAPPAGHLGRVASIAMALEPYGRPRPADPRLLRPECPAQRAIHTMIPGLPCRARAAAPLRSARPRPSRTAQRPTTVRLLTILTDATKRQMATHYVDPPLSRSYGLGLPSEPPITEQTDITLSLHRLHKRPSPNAHGTQPGVSASIQIAANRERSRSTPHSAVDVATHALLGLSCKADSDAKAHSARRLA